METDGDDKAVNAKMWSCHQVAYFNGCSVNFTVPQQCSLPDLLAVSPLGEKYKNRSSVRHTDLVSNFSSVSRCSGSQCTLSLLVGVNNIQNIEYFAKSETGQCVKIVQDRQNVVLKEQYSADISGTSDELRKHGLLGDNENKVSIERKTATGRFGGGLTRTLNGEKIHHITIQYSEIKPTKDTITSETTGTSFEVNYDGLKIQNRTRKARTRW